VGELKNGPPSRKRVRPGQFVRLPIKGMYEMITERTALLTVKKAAVYMDRTEKAIRHLYERGTLTPIRIDGRVQIDPNEIDFLIAKAKQSAQY
jgi:hypothetical protein